MPCLNICFFPLFPLFTFVLCYADSVCVKRRLQQPYIRYNFGRAGRIAEMFRLKFFFSFLVFVSLLLVCDADNVCGNRLQEAYIDEVRVQVMVVSVRI